MAAKYEIKKASDGQFHFVLKAGNGEVILASETYKAKASAQGGIESVKVNAPIDARYVRHTSDDKPHFVLKAANGEPLGQSQQYGSAAAMEKGIESVKANGPSATVEDLT